MLEIPFPRPYLGRRLTGIGLGLLTGLLLSATTAWVERVLDSHVAVSFPASPTVTTVGAQLTWQCRTGHTDFQALTAPVPTSTRLKTATETATFLRNVGRGALRSQGAQLISVREIPLGNLTAQELSYSLPDSLHPRRLRVGTRRLFARGRNLYVFDCQYPVRQHTALRDEALFFASIVVSPEVAAKR